MYVVQAVSHMAKLNLHIFLFIFCSIIGLFNVQAKSMNEPWMSTKHAALFVFGDSQFDAGNNNYINTTAKANYWPYGETTFKYPSGRFCDGRLVPDFIAEYAKLPYIPPYLHPGIDQFIYGVNFASAGAGALVETRTGSVIDLKTQIGYFKNVSRILRQQLGATEAKALLSRAVYLFGVASNDYIFPFETNSSVLHLYSVEQFVGLVLGNITDVIKEIYEIGGRKFGFPSVGPLGCLPSARVFEGRNKGGCFDRFAPYIELHNKQLSELLQNLQRDLNGFKYSILDVHTRLEEMINHPSKYGFEDGTAACCGSGPYRGISNCGGRRGVKEFQLCHNVSEYVFFDSGHPTEKAYQQLAQLYWSGNSTVTGPFNLKALFESY